MGNESYTEIGTHNMMSYMSMHLLPIFFCGGKY